MKKNPNFDLLNESYLFKIVRRKVSEFSQQYPDREIIRLGIGDVTLPIAPCVVRAMTRAVKEQGKKKTFHGYGDEQGEIELRKAIARRYPNISYDEVFVSDGAKSDLGNILEIFQSGITVYIPDPVYPAYVDANVISGNKIVHELSNDVDVIYICSPNNPTGEVASYVKLNNLVDFAIKNDKVIIFDGAYRDYIRDKSLPKTIYEIADACKCAIEINSFSKSAGFTGLRCGWTIVPKETGLHSLWLRRQTTKFNGASCIIQRGALASLSLKGRLQNGVNVDYYMENARLICETLTRQGIEFSGGQNAPYIWLKCPNGMSSWDYFDHMLERYGIVGTPGVGFGKNGEGFFRLTSFGNREDVIKACVRLEEQKCVE